MAEPIMRELIVAGPLPNISVAYRNKAYVGDRVFPIIDTSDPKAKIARYLKGAWFVDMAGIRAPSTRAKRGGYPIDLLDLATKEYAFAKEVTDEDIRFASSTGAPPLKPEQDAVEFCADKIDLSKEKRIAALVKATGWSGQAAGGEDAEGNWASTVTGANNTFIPDVEARIETIRSNTGLRPNVLLVSAITYSHLKQVDAVLDRIKYTQRGIVSADLIAALFGLEEVIIGDAIESTAKETKAGTEFTAAQIWEQNAGKGMAFLAYRPPSLGLKVPMAGVQVRLRYEMGLVRRTSRWRESAEHQDVFEVAEETDIVACGADLGFMWKDTIAT